MTRIWAILRYPSTGKQTRRKPLRYADGMGDSSKIVEVAFFSGRVLVTFEDGMMALLEPSQVRHFAEQTEALRPIPKGLLDSD